ncbi:hypothetical protein GOP47_0008849 [Adiantum capillus-veneris]|uniref:Uncharacterized protein n=1 Tax=Adiantum capillus-veneris TaxID=13818 RepID=A0A9D4UZE7_ADICA|nr:hypothetical protein GOP47_0008849 [Adiantum capillus-veneris]
MVIIVVAKAYINGHYIVKDEEDVTPASQDLQGTDMMGVKNGGPGPTKVFVKDVEDLAKNVKGEANDVKKVDNSEDGAKGGTTEKNVNKGKFQDKVSDLIDVDVDATDPEKVGDAMPTSPGDFTLSGLLSAVGRK